MTNHISLAGRTIVVTGGNSGIGEAIVLAAACANVVIDYVTNPAEETTALIAKIEASDTGAIGIQVDVSMAPDLARMKAGERAAPCRTAGKQDGTSMFTKPIAP